MKVYRRALSEARQHIAQGRLFEDGSPSFQQHEARHEVVSFALPWAFFPDECKEALFGGYAHAERDAASWAERAWNHLTYSGFTSYTTSEGFNAVSARFCCLGLIYHRFASLVTGNVSYEAASFLQRAWAALPLIRREEELDVFRFRIRVTDEYPEVAERLCAAYRDETALFEAMRRTIAADGSLFARLEELTDREQRGVTDGKEMYWFDVQALGWICDGMPLAL